MNALLPRKRAPPLFSAGSADDSFLIETENETAEYVDGKLTFTGNAILEVTALTGEDGILYVQDG